MPVPRFLFDSFPTQVQRTDPTTLCTYSPLFRQRKGFASLSGLTPSTKDTHPTHVDLVTVGDSWCDDVSQGFSCFPSLLAERMAGRKEDGNTNAKTVHLNLSKGGDKAEDGVEQVRRGERVMKEWGLTTSPDRTTLLLHLGGNNVLDLFFILCLFPPLLLLAGVEMVTHSLPNPFRRHQGSRVTPGPWSLRAVGRRVAVHTRRTVLEAESRLGIRSFLVLGNPVGPSLPSGRWAIHMSTLFLLKDESVTRILHDLPSVIESEVEKELKKVEEERGLSITFLPNPHHQIHAPPSHASSSSSNKWVDASHPGPESHSKIADAISSHVA